MYREENIKNAKTLAGKLLSETTHTKLEIVKQVWDTHKCDTFGLKEAKDVVDEMQEKLLRSTKENKQLSKVIHDFSQVYQDMDLYSELVEKIEGLESQIRLITKKYPYIKFPRYAGEPS